MPSLLCGPRRWLTHLSQEMGDARISVGVPHSGMGRSSTICFMTSVEVMR